MIYPRRTSSTHFRFAIHIHLNMSAYLSAFVFYYPSRYPAHANRYNSTHFPACVRNFAGFDSIPMFKTQMKTKKVPD